MSRVLERGVPFRSGTFQPLPLVTHFQVSRGRVKTAKWDWAKAVILVSKTEIYVKALVRPVTQSENSSDMNNMSQPS